MLITRALVEQAIEIVRPAAERLIATEGANWGPKWVEVLVNAPGIDSFVAGLFGEWTAWESNWGELKNFGIIAAHKLRLVEREKRSSSEIVYMTPHLLQDGELLYSGAAHHAGISVACSGIKGRADETIANMLIDVIIGLSQLEADRRRESNDIAQAQMYTLCPHCIEGRQTVMGLDSQCAHCHGNYRSYGFTDEQLAAMAGPKPF